MLRIYYGELPNQVWWGYNWFKISGDNNWLLTPLSKAMIQDIDKSKVIGPNLIVSPILGPIPPEKLSGGVLILICIAHADPNIVFNITGCGDNCAKWLLEIARRLDRDILVTSKYMMDFKEITVPIEIVNTGKIAHNRKEYINYSMEGLELDREIQSRLENEDTTI